MDSYELDRHRMNCRTLLHLADEVPPYAAAMLEIIAADYTALVDETVPVVKTRTSFEVPDVGD